MHRYYALRVDASGVGQCLDCVRFFTLLQCRRRSHFSLSYSTSSIIVVTKASFTLMPHSVSRETSPEVQDNVLPDAPPERTTEEKDLDGSSDSLSGADAEESRERKPKSVADVKLEDLFNSDDEDEEFPTSSAPDDGGKVKGSSPPAAPV